MDEILAKNITMDTIMSFIDMNLDINQLPL